MPRSKRCRLLAALTVGAVVAGACASDSSSEAAFVSVDRARATPDAVAAQPVADGSLAFAVDLYHELAAAETGNLVFSPHSIALALAMTRAGSAGETAVAMDQVLHAPDEPAALHAGFNALDQALESRAGEQERADGSTADLELTIANAIWGQVDTSFLEPFLAVLAEDYGAGMRLVDYRSDAEGARIDINDWIAEQTRDRITDLIPPGALNSLTRLVLTNAVYLLAPWELPFAEEATEPGPFQLADGGETEAPFMRLSGEIRYARRGSIEAVELPYAGRELAMLVLVPEPGSFSDVEASLDAATLEEIVEGLESRQVNLSFPRFEFRTQTSLTPALRALGMGVAFDPDAADFSAMTTDEQLFVADVVHEAFISVDEEGTEAAAATAVVMSATSAPTDPVTLDVDRPFVFALRDLETGAVLFLARVVDPTA